MGSQDSSSGNLPVLGDDNESKISEGIHPGDTSKFPERVHDGHVDNESESPAEIDNDADEPKEENQEEAGPDPSLGLQDFSKNYPLAHGGKNESKAHPDDDNASKFPENSPRGHDAPQGGNDGADSQLQSAILQSIQGSSSQSGESESSSAPGSPASDDQREECVICHVENSIETMRRADRCAHYFCLKCVKPYVGREVLEKQCYPVVCPDKLCAENLLEDETREYLNQYIEDRIHWAQTVMALKGAPRVIQCPSDYCKKPFSDDWMNLLKRACPHCNKLICMSSRVLWHYHLFCYEFQALKRAAMMPEMRPIFERILGKYMWCWCSNYIPGEASRKPLEK
ncbi:OLC1v1017313C1 [Oldenlandia corymbosa var. corymbosa]|uniref:OLC1v1017313C1 n=1 Tax=Oldenlandia corymbosa var. corymbosa TaxID=529605 RepID=A0AAV1E962_OLDCO|nr:OLC1v1017313C1 [Oldenlandia corymbosa var. corymbosa]